MGWLASDTSHTHLRTANGAKTVTTSDEENGNAFHANSNISDASESPIEQTECGSLCISANAFFSDTVEAPSK